MADSDNVRSLYEDGLVLGADELMDDQRYWRAAFERRSLTRDLPGIAYGLELGEASGEIFISPGVAYGGDGRAIVVRERRSLTPFLAYNDLRNEFEIGDGTVDLYVLLQYREDESRGPKLADLCGQTTDPRVAEGYDVVVMPADRFTAQHLDRIPPHENLAEDLLKSYPVLIGRISAVLESQNETVTPTVLLRIDQPICGGAAGAGYPRAAQYAGVIAQGLVHPRRWNDDGIGLIPEVSLALHPEEGVELIDPTTVRATLTYQQPNTSEGASTYYDATNHEWVFDICQDAGAHTAMRVRRENQQGAVIFEFQVEGTIGEFGELNVGVLRGIDGQPLDTIEVKDGIFDTIEVASNSTLKQKVLVEPLDPADVIPDLLEVKGGIKIQNGLDVGELAELKGGATVQGNATVNGDLTTTNLTVTNSASINVLGGALSLNGALTVNGDTTIAGTLDANRLEALTHVQTDTITVTGAIAGATTINGPTQINGATEINGAHEVNGPLEVNGGAHVTGALTADRGLAVGGPLAIGLVRHTAVAASDVQKFQAVFAQPDGSVAGTVAVADRGRVVGVAITNAVGGTAEIVTYGPAVAEVSMAVDAGDWLGALANGRLSKNGNGEGSRVAKALESTAAAGQIRVLVSVA